jgi:hypothetical protein
MSVFSTLKQSVNRETTSIKDGAFHEVGDGSNERLIKEQEKQMEINVSLVAELIRHIEAAAAWTRNQSCETTTYEEKSKPT